MRAPTLGPGAALWEEMARPARGWVSGGGLDTRRMRLSSLSGGGFCTWASPVQGGVAPLRRRPA